MKTIVVLSGSVRDERKSHFLALQILKTLNENQHFRTVLLDLKEYHFPIMTDVHVDKWPEGMKDFSERLSNADGIIIVSPEYKNSIPGALKNTFDYLRPQSLKHIPVGIVTVSSGGFGGVNCLAQLRLVTLALGGIPISEHLCISKVNDLFDKSGNFEEHMISGQTSSFVNDFLWYVTEKSK